MLIIGTVSFGYSQENAKDKYYKVSIHINLPVMETWNLITEIPNWKKWDNRIIDLRFDGQKTKRARGSLITKNGKVVEFITVDLVKGDTYTFKHKLSSGMLFIK